jgi:hypothetical protein
MLLDEIGIQLPVLFVGAPTFKLASKPLGLHDFVL